MSDTPRTDEEVETAKKFAATSHGLWVSAEFARQLERELTRQVNAVNALNEDCKYLEAKLAQAREDALEEAAQIVEEVSIQYENTSYEAAERIRALKNNAAQAAQNAAGQEKAHEHKLASDETGESDRAPSPAAPVADTQAESPSASDGQVGTHSDPSLPTAESASVVVPREHLLKLKNVFAGEALPHWQLRGETTEMRGRWLDWIDSMLAAAPASGPSEAPCRHEWYQGTCAHCKIDADDYRASLRLAGRDK